MLQLDFAQISLLSIVSLRPHVGWMSVSVWGLYFSLHEKCEYCDLCLSGHPLKNITTGPGSDSAPV